MSAMPSVEDELDVDGMRGPRLEARHLRKKEGRGLVREIVRKGRHRSCQLLHHVELLAFVDVGPEAGARDQRVPAKIRKRVEGRRLGRQLAAQASAPVR